MPQRLSDVPMSQLVAGAEGWEGGPAVLRWTRNAGPVEQAIGYGDLFWPDFVEHEDCILFKGFSEESFRGFWEQTQGDRRAIEWVMSHQHIIDLFPDADPTDEQILYLGRLIREMWAVKLARDFPARRFVVEFCEEETDDLLDYQVYFHQEPA